MSCWSSFLLEVVVVLTPPDHPFFWPLTCAFSTLPCVLSHNSLSSCNNSSLDVLLFLFQVFTPELFHLFSCHIFLHLQILFPSANVSTAFRAGHGATFTVVCSARLGGGAAFLPIVLRMAPLFFRDRLHLAIFAWSSEHQLEPTSCSLTQWLHPWPLTTASRTSSSATSRRPWCTFFASCN